MVACNEGEPTRAVTAHWEHTRSSLSCPSSVDPFGGSATSLWSLIGCVVEEADTGSELRDGAGPGSNGGSDMMLGGRAPPYRKWYTSLASANLLDQMIACAYITRRAIGHRKG